MGRSLISNPATREAAVVVPVYRAGNGELRLLLIRRSPVGAHGGQIAFPGGMRDAKDQTFLETALREFQEEMSVPADDVRILECLPSMKTLTTGYTVFPFLATVLNPGQWKPCEREVAEFFEVPVEYLARPEAHDFALETFAGWTEPQRVPCYRVGPYHVWGLTYRILQPLVPRLIAGEWRI